MEDLIDDLKDDQDDSEDFTDDAEDAKDDIEDIYFLTTCGFPFEVNFPEGRCFHIIKWVSPEG